MYDLNPHFKRLKKQAVKIYKTVPVFYELILVMGRVLGIEYRRYREFSIVSGTLSESGMKCSIRSVEILLLSHH